MVSEDKLLHLLFSGLYLLLLFERGYFQSKAMKISGELRTFLESKRKMAALILIFIVAQLWVIGSFVYIIKPTFMDWTRFPIPVWARWLGAIIAFSGMVLEFSTQINLGRKIQK